MKNLIFPSFVVLGILGLIVFFSSSSKNTTPTSSPASTSPTSSTQLSAYDENAKVMFFYSDLCSWCQKEKTVLEELAKEGYKVKPMDVKANPALWAQYNISGTPTFIAPDGQKLVGYQEKEKLKEFLDKYK